MNFENALLGDVAVFFNTQRKPITKAARLPGEYPYYGAGGVQDYVEGYLFDGEFILVGEDGTVVTGSGKPVIQRAAGKFWVNNHAHVIRPKDEGDFDFLFYAVANASVEDLVSGAVQPKLSMTNLKQLQIPWPEDGGIRRAIGLALRTLDRKAENNREIAVTLEALVQALFKSWFIDFDPVKAKMVGEAPVGMDAETEALFPDSMEEHGAVRVPAGWGFESLGNLDLILESGSRPKGGVKGFLEGVPSIGAESIQGIGVFDYSKTKYVPQEFFRGLRRGVPQHFDVLLYKDGGKPGVFRPRVGMFGRGFPFDEYAINEHVFLLRSGRLGQFFLHFLISSESVLDVLRERGAKAAIPGINQVDVKSLVTVVPPREVLDRFDEIAAPLVVEILELSKESNLLALIRDELLPRLISGELKIPEEMLGA